MSNIDGNLSGSPSVSGEFSSTISAMYANGDRADQVYLIFLRPPKVLMSAPELLSSTSISVFEVNATGGDDPQVTFLRQLIGTNFMHGLIGLN